MGGLKTTVIKHDIKKVLGLSYEDYVFIDLVIRMSGKNAPIPNWCNMSKAKLSEQVEVSERSLKRMIKNLFERQIIVKKNRGFLLSVLPEIRQMFTQKAVPFRHYGGVKMALLECQFVTRLVPVCPYGSAKMASRLYNKDEFSIEYSTEYSTEEEKEYVVEKIEKQKEKIVWIKKSEKEKEKKFVPKKESFAPTENSENDDDRFQDYIDKLKADQIFKDQAGMKYKILPSAINELIDDFVLTKRMTESLTHRTFKDFKSNFFYWLGSRERYQQIQKSKAEQNAGRTRKNKHLISEEDARTVFADLMRESEANGF